MSGRRGVVGLVAVSGFVSGGAAGADVITGTVVNQAGFDQPSELAGGDPFVLNAIEFGDGINGVAVSWSLATFAYDEPSFPLPSHSAWFYATNHSLVGADIDQMDVAWAQGVTEIGQITDASVFDFVSASEGSHLFGHDHRFADAQSNNGRPGSTHGGGVGDFLVLRNAASGHYGVLRLDMVHTLTGSGRQFAHLDATWWFQTDGTGSFGVPSPASAIPIVVAGALGWRRRRA